MIEFHKEVLDNGLRVIVHPDTSTTLAAVNIMYDVGSRDESPSKTGFAHLFEHLMFGGSRNIPSFDQPLQKVGGENNAWTSPDFTNYYVTLPACNLETAFWLESDRMLELDFSQGNLDVQRKVVMEEFKQRYLNQPYGDLQLLSRPLAYKVHPYQWPVIGKDLSHIENATLEDVKMFFYRHYAPNNAVMVVAGNVSPRKVFSMASRWFGDIPRRPVPAREIPGEPQQTAARRLEVRREVPGSLLHITFHVGGRTSSGYHAADLLSDIFSNGPSSRFEQRLIKERQLFSDVNAYISGDLDPGLFTVSGRLMPGVEISLAEKAVFDELAQVANYGVPEQELQKVKNKIESTLMFSEVSFLNKAINLAQHEMMGNAGGVNNEVELYRSVTTADIRSMAEQTFKPGNSSILHYLAKSN